MLFSALVQYEVEVHTGDSVPFFSEDNELLITLCNAEHESEELALETVDGKAPELAQNSVSTKGGWKST